MISGVGVANLDCKKISAPIIREKIPSANMSKILVITSKKSLFTLE
jgi:hypothetical protein